MTITTLEDDNPLLKPKDATAYLSLSETTLRRLHNEGVIPRVRLTNTRNAFRLGDLREYAKSRPVEHGGALG